MNVDTLKTRLYTLLQPIMGGTVIWADQSAPRPPLPYTTLRLGVISQVGLSHYSAVDNSGIQTVLLVRESVLNVQRFGANSMSTVETFADKLALNTNLDKFGSNEISMFDVSNVTDIAQLLNGIAIEPRASVDISLRWTSDQADNVGIIQTVNSNGTLGPKGTKLNEAYPVTVVTVAY
jgi:hypothetical protein